MAPLRATASDKKAMVSTLITPRTASSTAPASGPIPATAMGNARMVTPTVSVMVSA
jgi:hypothetical protein